MKKEKETTDKITKNSEINRVFQRVNLPNNVALEYANCHNLKALIETIEDFVMFGEAAGCVDSLGSVLNDWLCMIDDEDHPKDFRNHINYHFMMVIKLISRLQDNYARIKSLHPNVIEEYKEVKYANASFYN